MKTTIKDGKLIIEIDLQEPTLSSTGKSYVVASSWGFKSNGAEIDGKTVSVNITAIVKAGAV